MIPGRTPLSISFRTACAVAAALATMVGVCEAVCGRVNRGGMGVFKVCQQTATECEFFTDDGPERTCRQWCSQSNMDCIGGWKEDDGCGHEYSYGCDRRNVSVLHIAFFFSIASSFLPYMGYIFFL